MSAQQISLEDLLTKLTGKRVQPEQKNNVAVSVAVSGPDNNPIGDLSLTIVNGKFEIKANGKFGTDSKFDFKSEGAWDDKTSKVVWQFLTGQKQTPWEKTKSNEPASWMKSDVSNDKSGQQDQKSFWELMSGKKIGVRASDLRTLGYDPAHLEICPKCRNEAEMQFGPIIWE